MGIETMKVKNTLKVYELNGKELDSFGSNSMDIEVTSHWNRNSLVNIVVDGKEITVCARELSEAIKNSTNTGRF